MTVSPLFALFLILWFYFWDAVRDAWWLRANRSWLAYHAPKWLSVHAVGLFLTVYFFDWVYWAPIMVGCWIVWQIGMRWPGGRDWESMWIKLFKQVIDKCRKNL